MQFPNLPLDGGFKLKSFSKELQINILFAHPCFQSSLLKSPRTDDNISKTISVHA